MAENVCTIWRREVVRQWLLDGPRNQQIEPLGEGMNRTLGIALAVAVGALASANADNAYAMDELFSKHNCTACHKQDKKLVGPSYNDVAAKYKGQKDAEAFLAKKIKEGSTGVWGPVPMPQNGAVPDEDIKKLAKAILGGK
jgi:cytochrome c